MIKFNKQEAEHSLERLKLEAELSHPFALKMASLICFSVLSMIILLGIFFGERTIVTIGITIVIAIIFAMISFKITYSSCL